MSPRRAFTLIELLVVKELWVRPLGAKALAQLGARELPPELTAGGPALPPLPPVKTPQMESLWSYARRGLTDPRSPKEIGRAHV